MLCAIAAATFVSASHCSTREEPAGHQPISRPAGDTAGAGRDIAGAPRGHILFSPLLSTMTYLIDPTGQVVHTWDSGFAPGASVYLLDNGHLLRPARDPELPFFSGGGQGGRIQEFTWDGRLVWDFVLGNRERMPHHDVAPLPNGNVLAIVWERKSGEGAIRSGRRPQLVGDGGLWPDSILEISPVLPDGGKIVWEWHVWDHVIQDHDPTGPNYGKVSDHPELVDINGDHGVRGLTEEAIERLQALGYILRGTPAAALRADFLHMNSIAYNPALDQIALSVSRFNELWIIDHSTTKAQASGHSGGRAGRGGDLLYRWGNPRMYGRGSSDDQQLFGQHDVRWIPPGLPGAGSLTIFDNGSDRPSGDYSAVIEIAPPLAGDGSYELPPGAAFGPARPTWTYTAPDKRSFSADFISGAHRLPNGNTFICSGPTGYFFEVTPKGDIVWTYHNPFSGDAPNPSGDPPRSVFRATQIPPQHPALLGRTLKPLDPQPPLLDSQYSRRQH
ncbi:MAG: aryl-sulfate sulfotransferase [Acidobacteriota bacterium]